MTMEERQKLYEAKNAALAQSDAEPNGWQLVKNGDPICLRDCPEGLFLFNGTLCFKSEYKTEVPGPQWQCDAYVIESGEYFQGGSRSVYERERLVVQPLAAALAQSNAEPSQDVLTTVRKRIELVVQQIADTELIAMLRTAMRELDLALSPVRVTDEMVMAASDVLFERTSIAFGGTYMREALEAAINPKQVALYTAPPRPDYELSAIAAAIGSSRFMDPPDGGDVSLAEQVCRMREALEKAEAALAQSDAIPVRAFAKAVLHGDDEHRAWLIEAAEAFIAGKPLPPPRGKGTKQSDAEPVGGLAKARTIALEQRCERGTPWDLACVTIANKIGEQCGYPPIPTDTTPPRPDVSAGLIEAAEITREWAGATSSLVEAHLLDALAREIRARAADRSWK